MTTIYIVYGNTGKYSNRSEWPVAAYMDQALARAHVERAAAWYASVGGEPILGRYDCKLKNPYDPNMSVDYTGTDWYVGQVELRTELPNTATQDTAPA